MELDDAADQRQSDPQTLRMMRRASRLLEEVEDVGQHLRGDANPLVTDVHDGLSRAIRGLAFSRRSARCVRPCG